MVSIILPVKDRLELTKQTIQSILDNTKVRYELIVVDDGSSEQTQQYLATLPANVKVIFSDETKGCGAARNAGAAIAKYKYLYFTDNDVYFKPDWLRTLVRAYQLFQADGLRVLGGEYHPHHGELERLSRNNHTVRISDQQPGFSMLMSRDHFLKVGPFVHNEVGKYGVEDSALCTITTEMGYKVGALVPNVLYHCGITNSSGQKTAGYEHFIYKDLPEGVIQI